MQEHTAFPIRPMRSDEVQTVFLDLFEAPNYHGVFVLGCFARYVTIYSQQVRALNLIDCLVKQGRLSRSSSLAVIGGGIAGLTAAAGAAVKGVRSVRVFEKGDSTMRDQRVCTERFLHPHIYDWPQMEKEGSNAGLAVMDWDAGEASKVVEQLDKNIADLQAKGILNKDFVTANCGSVELRPGRDSAVEVKQESGDWQGFDAAIIAIGFGVDSLGDTFPYWQNFGLDSSRLEKPGESWFVSGFGDGALTDLMRLCIRDFLHEKVLQAFRTLPALEEVATDLVREERNAESSDLAAIYRAAGAKLASAFQSQKALEKRSLGPTFLNCSESELFSPRSSILNRLICACLLQEGRFQLVPGKIEAISKTQSGFEIAFQDSPGPPFSAGHLILRHGPHADGAGAFGEDSKKQLEAAFPDLWEETATLRAVWQTAQKHQDWTRLRLFSADDFTPGVDYSHQLRVTFGQSLKCLLVRSSEPEMAPALASRVESGLAHFAKRIKSYLPDLRIEPKPAVISIEEVFTPSAPWRFERALRAICEAPVAILDLSGEESSMMLLLGIRAAVRRGVTIIVTRRENFAKSLPFNISSLNPIVLGDSRPGKETWRLLSSALEAGFQSLQDQPHRYLDLPVFDSVREIGGDASPRQPATQILFLRWFDERYGNTMREFIDGPLELRYSGTRILTILDSQSPQLVEQRLYAEIRRTKLCIADWTGWRPNVFFEIGVRLAVNSEDPVHILCTKAPAQWDGPPWFDKVNPTDKNLQLFFQPCEFDFEQSSQIEMRIDQFGHEPPPGVLSPARIYRIVSQLVPWEKEPGGQSVEQSLRLQAKLLDGAPGPDETTLSPVLYGEALSERARNAAVEHLLAAYYYLRERNAIIARLDNGEAESVEANARELIDIGQEVAGRMRTATNPEFKPLRIAILKEIRSIQGKLNG